MTLFRHPNSGVWFMDIRHNGKRIKRSTGTRDKAQAKQLHDQFKADLWRQGKLGDDPQYTWDQAALEYSKTITHQRDYAGKVRYLRYWTEQLRGMKLTDITSDVIERSAPTTQTTHNGTVEPLSGGTVNRYLATVSAVLRYAYKRGWLPGVPHIAKRAEAPVRELFATREQADALLEAMGEGWLRDVTEFAFFTGMRSGEILTLEWGNVTLNQRLVSLPGSRAKSGSGRAVPLNNRAMEVIKRRRGKHKVLVFARRNKVAPRIDTEKFKRAVEAAGLPSDFRFHDCRHSWASWHAQRGTPMLTLQRLGGWKTLSMLNKYAHFATEDLATYAGAID